jgi:hypothetical protein
MKKIAYWIPAAFCALISFIALFKSIGIPSFGTPGSYEVFFAFLPMCFFFVAFGTTHLQRELNELRRRITDLEQKPR